jgi:hypothetical protein
MALLVIGNMMITTIVTAMMLYSCNIILVTPTETISVLVFEMATVTTKPILLLALHALFIFLYQPFW